MKKFMDENFLLSNEVAVRLYNDYVKNMPIYDYHCHLSTKEIYENKRYGNITELWLYGDHYKWRVMRSNGIQEKYITGDASDYEKFLAWSKTVPMTLGNPLYHWTHLELQRYFGIYEVLNENTAERIWEKANILIQGQGFSARDLIVKSNVKVICTTDDPIDALEYHQKLKNDKDFNVKVIPAFRPDNALEINKEGYIPWIKKLEKVSEQNITNYNELLLAIENRMQFFHAIGCRISDHSLTYVPYEETSKEEVAVIFEKVLRGKVINKEEENKYKTYTLYFLGTKYSEFGWTMQLHIGAMRNNNTRMFNKLGADSGFDSMNDSMIAYPLSRLLDSLAKEDALPKIILYTLNPKDNYVLASMLGNFQGSGIPGKIQFGSGWWFNDNKDGMIEQIKALANCGVLSRFVGMLTDSRSFLSYTRHEYFRRILCNFIGELVENGEFPYDISLLGKIVQDISFNNAKDYFSIEF